MRDLFDLTGKTVVITGGATHLGRAMSEALCRYGANLVIGSRDAERNRVLAAELSQRYEVSCIGLELDFASEKSSQQFIESVLKKHGRVDILLNNAAFSNPGSIEEQPLEAFMKGVEGTLGGTYCITQQAVKAMLTQGGGNIINVGSMYGVVSPDPALYEGTSNTINPMNYGCGKAAIGQMTRYLACRYGRKGIRANCVVPGPFPNPQVQKDELFAQKLADKTPLGRIGQPGDLMGAVVFLASDASSYITGQSLHVDGGWTAW
ncbi:SDR family oxidoreductase [Oscillospiraceae bacterium MB08-C2-2]|nr:SDR family oxidoreductase [Oscillospiraceae bacterium MB08-C2-2]